MGHFGSCLHVSLKGYMLEVWSLVGDSEVVELVRGRAPWRKVRPSELLEMEIPWEHLRANDRICRLPKSIC